MDFIGNRFASTKRRFSDINDRKHSPESIEAGFDANRLKHNFAQDTQAAIAQSDQAASPKGNYFERFDPSTTDNDADYNGSDADLKLQEEMTYENQVASANYSNFSEVLGRLGQDGKMVILQFSQTFNSSEDYEQQSAQAVTQLAEHATILEQRLKLQKEMLCDRLQTISHNLKIEM